MFYRPSWANRHSLRVHVGMCATLQTIALPVLSRSSVVVVGFAMVAHSWAGTHMGLHLLLAVFAVMLGSWPSSSANTLQAGVTSLCLASSESQCFPHCFACKHSLLVGLRWVHFYLPTWLCACWLPLMTFLSLSHQQIVIATNEKVA